MKIEIREAPEVLYTLTAKDVSVGQFVEDEKGIICFKMHDNDYTKNKHGSDMTHDLMVRTSDWTSGWCSGWTLFRSLLGKEVVFIQNEEGQ